MCPRDAARRDAARRDAGRRDADILLPLERRGAVLRGADGACDETLRAAHILVGAAFYFGFMFFSLEGLLGGCSAGWDALLDSSVQRSRKHKECC